MGPGEPPGRFRVDLRFGAAAAASMGRGGPGGTWAAAVLGTAIVRLSSVAVNSRTAANGGVRIPQ